MLTGGQVADCTAGARLLEQLSRCDILPGEGDDSNAIQHQIADHGAMANIPAETNRKWKTCFSPVLYRNRNAIERMFCPLKDFRRVATRYDRRAVNVLSAACSADTISYWL
jgi:transposase